MCIWLMRQAHTQVSLGQQASGYNWISRPVNSTGSTRVSRPMNDQRNDLPAHTEWWQEIHKYFYLQLSLYSLKLLLPFQIPFVSALSI